MMTKKELYPGVNLTVIPSAKFKTNYMMVGFVVPLEKATAHLTALFPKILSRGCVKYPDMAKISERLEYLYASGISPVFIKRAETLVVGFSADFIKDSYVPDGKSLLCDVCDLLFSVLLDPVTENGAFRDDYTESEKADLINMINSRINNKAAYAKEKCISAMFGDHPYGICEYGTVSDVKSATSAQIYERYRTVIETAPIEIYFNGECDENALAELITGYIKPSDNRKNEFPGRTFLSGSPSAVNELEEEMPVAQGKLVMGLRIGGININSTDSAAFAVFNELFGGSPSSKLFMNVREAMSLCYYCRSMPDQYMSAMFISSGIETENRDRAKNAILQQLADVCYGKFTESDIDDAKLSIKNSYRELDDSASATCSWYLSRSLFASDETPETVTEKISAVTKEDIVRVAKLVELDTVYFIKGTGCGDEEVDE